MTVLGAILAGGRSTRFGSDKALAELNGRPLLAHAADILAAVADEIVVCGRAVAIDDLPTLSDVPRPGLGPLGGLCAALVHARTRGHALVLSIGCDTPALDGSLLARLLAAGDPVHLADAPIIGCWPAALAAALMRHLDTSSDYSVRRWAAGIGAESIRSDAQVPNLNRASDLEALRQTLRD